MKTKIFTLVLAFVASVGCISAQTAKIYATVNAAGTTLTLDYTSSPASGAVDYWPVDLYPNVTKVVFNASIKEARPTTTAEWFDNYTKLTTIEHIDYLNTSEVTDMNRMFENCFLLKSLDLSTFNTAKVKNMEAMFYGCGILEELNVGGWNTAEVTKMGSMFSWCSKLKSLDLTSFNTQKVAQMGSMFASCSALTTIYCNDDWSKNTALTSSYDMFKDCEKLVGGNGTKWDNSKVDKTYACPDKEGQPGYFTEVVPRIYTEFVESTGTLIFYYDDKYISRTNIVKFYDPIETTNSWTNELYQKVTKAVFDASMEDARPTSTANWFLSYSNLTTIEHLGDLNTSKVTDMSQMFRDCKALTKLNLSTFQTQNVTDMNRMFNNCNALADLDVSEFNTRNVTDMGNMFSDCYSLKELDVSGWDTKNVRYMGFMFFSCESLTSLDLSNFDVHKVEGMMDMFYDCQSLTTIFCDDDWSTLPLKNKGENMFAGCSNLVGGNGTKYDFHITDKTYARPDKDGQPGYFTAKNTAIENVNQQSKINNQKLIKNGQLFIQRGDEVFNAQGARVK